MNVCSQALYQCLIEDLMETTQYVEHTDVPPDVSPRTFAASQLANDFLSKLQDDLKPTAEAKALEKFIASNQGCRTWELRKETLLDEYLIGEFRLAVQNFLEPRGEPLYHSLYDLLDHGRTGPGSSIGAKGQSFYAKFFSSKLSTTRPLLYEMYNRWTVEDHNWCEAEILRVNTVGPYDIVHGSRLAYAPKKEDCARVICIEPSLNMYYQLGLEVKLKDRLRSSFGIDLSTQPDVNRYLARVGSETGQFSTIDLSSASDSISLSMLEQLFPRWFVDDLKAIRSPAVEIPGRGYEELHMVSSMGNGSTFPLETMIFACAVRAVYKLDCIREFKSPGSVEHWNFSVFGDDIIIDGRSFRKLKRLLNLLGFQVNSSKTFVEGPFRESCGFDYFRGQYVRSVFVKTLRNQGSLYALINNLNWWSYKTGIPLTRTVKYLLRGVKWYPIPLHENEDAGVRIPSTFLKSQRRDKHTGSYLYECYVPRQRGYRISEYDIKVPRGSKSLIYNPHGLLLAYLRGHISAGKIAVRLDSPSYRRKHRVTPHWDDTGSTFRVKSEGEWRRLITALYFNLRG